jgi:transcription elongation factor GreA
MNLSDAINDYLSRQRKEKLLLTERNLQLFARWCGHDRLVERLIPGEVENYANVAPVPTGDKQTHLNIVKGFLTYLKRESLTTMNLAPHVKIPRVARNNAVVPSMAIDAIAMTASGQAAMRKEMIELKGQRVNVAEAIRLAAADKDFKENAPLDAAREAQGKMEARIKEIEETLRRAVTIEKSAAASRENVGIGSTLILENLSSGQKKHYMLVDSAEADPLSGKLSIASPVGKAIVGHGLGDEVDVAAPKGVLRFRITSVGK